MTRPMCACGCGSPLTVSDYWAGELCLMRWMWANVQSEALPATAPVYGFQRGDYEPTELVSDSPAPGWLTGAIRSAVADFSELQEGT